jgi:hypothetical protein
MAQYTIAYKNDDTIEHAERTGDKKGGWVRCYAWSSREDVLRVFNGMVERNEYKGSILGMFIHHENEVTAWFDRSPRREYDTRDKSKWPIRGFEGLINSRSSVDI